MATTLERATRSLHQAGNMWNGILPRPNEPDDWREVRHAIYPISAILKFLKIGAQRSDLASDFYLVWGSPTNYLLSRLELTLNQISKRVGTRPMRGAGAALSFFKPAKRKPSKEEIAELLLRLRAHEQLLSKALDVLWE
jgi:hypothetical protein